MDLTTAGLISDIQLNALLPDGMYEDSDIISFLNDAYFSDVLAFVMMHREDFYVGYEDFSPASSIAIPSDAIAQKLKDVQLKKSDNRFVNIPRLSQNELNGNSTYYRNNGFYIQDNTIYFHPNTPSDNIRVTYFKRPPYLMDSADAFPVTSVSGTKAYVTGTFVAGTVADKTISKLAQPNYAYTDISMTTGYDTGYYFEMSAIDIAKVSAGDYICTNGYSVYPRIPLEARDLLVQAAIMKAMISMKDKDGYALAKDQLAEAKRSISGLISPRIDNEVKKIVNTNSGIWSKNSLNNGWRK